MTWQSDRARDFRQRTEGKLAAHWGEIRQYLAPPVVAWSWGESGLSTAMKHYLKDKGLIKRAPGGEKWRTSMDLWCYAISKAGDEEPVGVEATGQQTLDAPPQSGSSRVLTDDTPAPPSRRVQSTLTGDEADKQAIKSQYEPDWTVVNALKGMHGDDGREDAARHPGQARLSTFEDYDLSQWDVTTPWFRSGVTVPAGNVY